MEKEMKQIKLEFFDLSMDTMEEPKKFSITIEGESSVPSSQDLKVRAAKELIESIDEKIESDEDPEFKQKSYLEILDTIGAMLQYSPGFNGEDRNIEVVKRFIEWAIESGVLDREPYKSLLDQKDY